MPDNIEDRVKKLEEQSTLAAKTEERMQKVENTLGTIKLYCGVIIAIAAFFGYEGKQLFGEVKKAREMALQAINDVNNAESNALSRIRLEASRQVDDAVKLRLRSQTVELKFSKQLGAVADYFVKTGTTNSPFASPAGIKFDDPNQPVSVAVFSCTGTNWHGSPGVLVHIGFDHVPQAGGVITLSLFQPDLKVDLSQNDVNRVLL